MSEEARALAWEQSFEDHVDAHRALVWDRLRVRWPLIAGLTAVAMGLAAMIHWIGALVLLGFVGLVLVASARKASLRNRLERMKEGLPVGPVRWELDRTRLLVRLPSRTITVPWKSIRRVRQTSELVLVYVGRARALFVPKRAVDDPAALMGAIEAFRESPEAHRPLPLPADASWTFAWTPTMGDHIAYVAGVQAQQPIRIGLVFLGLCVMLFSSLQLPLVMLDGPEPLSAVSCMLVPFGALIVMVGLGGRATGPLAGVRVRFARWADPESFPLEPIEIRADDHGLAYQSSRGSGRIAWSAVTSVDDVSSCVNLMLGPMLGFSVPDRAFDDRASRSRFMAEADRWSTLATRKTEVTGERGVPVPTDNPFEPPANR